MSVLQIPFPYALLHLARNPVKLTCYRPHRENMCKHWHIGDGRPEAR